MIGFLATSSPNMPLAGRKGSSSALGVDVDVDEASDYRQHMSAPHVLSIAELDAAKHVLQRTRAVTVMAERMAAAGS